MPSSRQRLLHAPERNHRQCSRYRLRRRLFHGRARRTRCRDIYGIDVSKAAIRAAAKRHPSIAFVVASSQRLPLIDASFDAATAILAPIDAGRRARARQRRHLVRVSPGPDHLRDCASSRTRICDRIGALPHNYPASSTQASICSSSPSTPTRAARADLIAMTPMLHRTRDDQRQRALAPEHLTIEAGFWIDVFRKRK